MLTQSMSNLTPRLRESHFNKILIGTYVPAQDQIDNVPTKPSFKLRFCYLGEKLRAFDHSPF